MTEALDTQTLDAGIRLNQADNVAVCTRRLEAGTQTAGVVLGDDIPRGHKFALTAIAEGAPVLKERILEAIRAFVEDHEQADDITLVLLERIAS